MLLSIKTGTDILAAIGRPRLDIAQSPGGQGAPEHPKTAKHRRD
jgi:hypothetical protein